MSVSRFTAKTLFIFSLLIISAGISLAQTYTGVPEELPALGGFETQSDETECDFPLLNVIENYTTLAQRNDLFPVRTATGFLIRDERAIVVELSGKRELVTIDLPFFCPNPQVYRLLNDSHALLNNTDAILEESVQDCFFGWIGGGARGGVTTYVVTCSAEPEIVQVRPSTGAEVATTTNEE